MNSFNLSPVIDYAHFQCLSVSKSAKQSVSFLISLISHATIKLYVDTCNGVMSQLLLLLLLLLLEMSIIVVQCVIKTLRALNNEKNVSSLSINNSCGSIICGII